MNREYLKDSAFLRELDKYNNKFYYVKIIVLDMNENPIRAIEGRVQSGASINIDGSSAVRRTCNLSFVALEEENNLTDVENLLSINKKIKVEVGIKNTFPNKYDDDIFWFPQGIFVIVNPSISNSASGCTISLTCKDKMCLLNGECGGNLPASITFHEYNQVLGSQEVTSFSEITEPNNRTVYIFPTVVTLRGESSQYWQWSKTRSFFATSEKIVEKILAGEVVTIAEPNLVYDIIQTLVCNYGGEGISKIIINDVPLEIKQIVRNNGSGSVFYNAGTGEYSIDQSLSVDTTGNWIEFEPSEDCGYVYTDFVYPGELISNIGENICSVLDKIKNTLGNYEYFYDINGNFVFQEIRNYLNVSYSPIDMGKMITPLNYTSPIFGDSLNNIEQLPTNQERIDLIIEAINNGNSSINNCINNINGITSLILEPSNGNFDNDTLKLNNSNLYNLNSNNDLIIDNSNSQSDDNQTLLSDTEINYNITYPTVEGGFDRVLISYVYNAWEQINNLFILDDYNYLVDYDSNKKSVYNFDTENGLITNISNTPNYTNVKNDFHVWGKGESNSVIHYHLVVKEKPKIMNTYKVILTDDGQLKINEQGIDYTPDDWRVEIYLQGKTKEALQQRPNIYEQEILDLLPTIYEFKQTGDSIMGKYKEDVTKVNNLKYFIDYLEPVNDLYDCSVDLIGSRLYSYQQDKIVKLYNNDIPNIIVVNTDGDETYNNQVRERCEKEGQEFSNVDGTIYSTFSIGTLGYSAQEVARDLLYQYTDYNNSITFQSIPIYYLEPNTRITVTDKKSNVYGDYIIKSISRPLDGQGTMSITATRALERI